MKPVLSAHQIAKLGDSKKVIQFWQETVLAQLACQVPAPAAIDGADEVLRALADRLEMLKAAKAKPLESGTVVQLAGGPFPAKAR